MAIQFDRATGDMYIADVGEWEFEVDYQPANSSGGANYGWHCWQGFEPYVDCEAENYVPPLLTYPTGGYGECSITGGYVYRGTEMPGLNGYYIYGDFVQVVCGSQRMRVQRQRRLRLPISRIIFCQRMVKTSMVAVCWRFLQQYCLQNCQTVVLDKLEVEGDFNKITFFFMLATVHCTQAMSGRQYHHPAPSIPVQTDPVPCPATAPQSR